MYKFRGFQEQPSHLQLLSLFCEEFHLNKEIVSHWFNTTQIDIVYDETTDKREPWYDEIISIFGINNKTISFSSPYSVTARAGELSRAPFVQTLYAGMDSVKCLLILKDDIDNYYPSNNYRPMEINNIDYPRQIIYYGAPGTGKSYKIKKQLIDVPKNNIFRTTFHPDSDYSTFVGAYKPTMEKPTEQFYEKDVLISKLTEFKKQGVTYSPQKFGAKYLKSLKRLTFAEKKDILLACGMSDNYTVEFDKGIAVGEELLDNSKESRIVYNFISQSFLNAYIQAYKKPEENVYLIIEEINRGNCAQIFGDLFQLLDRDDKGISEYTIKADADLRAFLEEELGKDSDGIKEGELCLPSNFYIYATMNTSDQSLFPIDSAFKRRWDWEYESIKYKNTDWVIDVQGEKYSWISFQKEINKRIFDATSSEDKMLGDYFVNPSDGIITEKMLLNKILFYLWNDVCKDGEGDIFKTSDTDDISFSDLYGDESKQKLAAMMDYLRIGKIGDNVEDASEDDAVGNQPE
ncbi:MAG: AAA family ATPase [Prevotellaceae bacterium]|nr:AAA family ATPase [Prevotellaceae bacterium]